MRVDRGTVGSGREKRSKAAFEGLGMTSPAAAISIVERLRANAQKGQMLSALNGAFLQS